MEVVRPSDARSFLELAGPLLGRDEARHNLILGIAGFQIGDNSGLTDRLPGYAEIALNFGLLILLGVIAGWFIGGLLGKLLQRSLGGLNERAADRSGSELVVGPSTTLHATGPSGRVSSTPVTVTVRGVAQSAVPNTSWLTSTRPSDGSLTETGRVTAWVGAVRSVTVNWSTVSDSSTISPAIGVTFAPGPSVSTLVTGIDSSGTES